MDKRRSEYLKKIKDIETKYQSEKEIEIQNLATEYVLKNSKYKVGDIVEGLCETIKIESIGLKYSWPDYLPEPSYHGVKLKKNKEPMKGSPRYYVFGGMVVGGWRKDGKE